MAIPNFNGQQMASGNNSFQPQPKGTGFVNLNQYLQANQGLNLGNTLAQGVKNDASRVNQALGNSQQQFNQAIGNVNNQTNNYQNQANQAFSTLDTNYGSLNQQANGNPSQYNATQYKNYNLGLGPQDYQNFQNIRNDQYNGPTGLNNIDQIQQQALQVQNLGNLTNSAAGRAALLGRYVNNPQYNSYQQNLDSLYLQNSQPDLRNAYRTTQNIYNQTVDANNNAADQATLAKANINNLQQNVANGINTRQNNELSALNNLASKYGTDQTNAINQLQTDLAYNRLSEQEKELTGLGTGTRLYNVAQNPQNIKNNLVPEFSPNQANVANVADRANLYALQQLAGSGTPTIDLSNNQYDPSKPYTFNTSGFMNLINGPTGVAQQYNNAYNSQAGIGDTFISPWQETNTQNYGNLQLGNLQLGMVGMPTAAQQLSYLNSLNPSSNGFVNSKGNTYYVGDKIAQLQNLLNNVKNKYGYNNVVQ